MIRVSTRSFLNRARWGVILGSTIPAFANPAHAAHTLEESLALLARGRLQTQLLVVKNFDDSHAADAPNIGFGISGYHVTSLFSSLLSKHSGQRLRGYESHHFPAPLPQQEAAEILRVLYGYPQVEFAYFEPITSDAAWNDHPPASPSGSASIPSPNPIDESGQPTPDYQDLQFYLKPAPTGIDAEFAWTQPGGAGQGVRIIDAERGWISAHTDFAPNFWSNGVNLQLDHGTAVWGEIAAKKDGVGITGIAYDSDFGTAGVVWNDSLADYITASPQVYEAAATHLHAGDVLLIEQHAPGPDQDKFCPVEYWQANFDVIRAIVDQGIVVVEAGGNGASDLSSSAYKRTFDRDFRDSGAIIVGAGGPPTESTHLQKLEFSNYGPRIDAFGYGEGVVSTGFGDLHSSANRLSNYTKNFSGTSSATPIVAGAVVALEGIARAQGVLLTPSEVRNALHATGSQQLGNRLQPIGNLPDLRALRQYFCANHRLTCN